MSEWLQDHWFATLAVTTGVLVLFAVGSGSDRTIRGHKIKLWRLLSAVLWVGWVLGVGVATRVDEDLAPCKTSSVVTTPGTSLETGSGADGATSKSVRSEPTTATTETCEPVSVAEVAVLLLPAVLLISPILKGITIAGLGTFDLKEEVNQIKKETAEQVVRVVFQQEIGTGLAQATGDLDAGQVEPLPDE